MEGVKVDPKVIEELERQKKLLLADDADSLDEDGYSKNDPYAAAAKQIDKQLAAKNSTMSNISDVVVRN
jgi:hypothetical protein